MAITPLLFHIPMEQANTQAIDQEIVAPHMGSAIRFTPRILAASIFSPSIPALLFLLDAYIESNHSTWAMIIVMASCATSYLGFFAIGLPGLFMLNKRGKLTTMNLSAYGAATGAAFYMVIVFLFFAKPISMAYFFNLLLGIFFGGSIAFVFGLISGIKMR